MKLKKILRESKKDRKIANELEKVLHKRYQDNHENLIYRASNRKIEDNNGYWTIRPIRKDRRPRDTSKITHYFILGVEDAFYPDVPSRAGSKFGVANYNQSELNNYGRYHFVCFPERGAKVYSLPEDSLAHYIGTLRHTMADLVNMSTGKASSDLSEYGATQKFVEYINQKYDDKLDHQKFKKFVENNFQKMRSELKKMKRDGKEVYDNFIKKYELLFQDLFEYFNNFEPGVKEGSNEVLFSGETYLKIEHTFFEEYFEWRGSKWRLKSEYMN